MPTYAYARNSPVKYSDPTGLLAWLVECPALGSINRGAVIGYEEPLGATSSNPIVRFGGGHSGLITGFEDPCDDLDKAIELEHQYSGNQAFWLQRDCLLEGPQARDREILSRDQETTRTSASTAAWILREMRGALIAVLVMGMAACLGSPRVAGQELRTECFECDTRMQSFRSTRCEISCDAGCLQLACDGGLTVPVIKSIGD